MAAAACSESSGGAPDAQAPGLDAGSDAGPLDCRTRVPGALTLEPTPTCGTPDALVHYNSICERCESEGFSVIVQVGNRGMAAIDEDTLRIEVFGAVEDAETRMLTTVTVPDAIASGEVLAGIEIEIEDELLSAFESIGIRVAGIEDDCQPGNDALGLIGPFCEPHDD